MAKYAADTTVSIARSVQELERIVVKYGATGFGYGTDSVTGRSQVMFRIADRAIRFEIKTPDPGEFRLTPALRTRTPLQQQRMAAEEHKRRWRGLVRVVSGLLVGVAEGIISLSDAFLPYTVIPGGQTFGEWAAPQLDYAAASGQLPSPLPGGNPTPLAIERGYVDAEIVPGSE